MVEGEDQVEGRGELFGSRSARNTVREFAICPSPRSFDRDEGIPQTKPVRPTTPLDSAPSPRSLLMQQ
mgnify:CR=1 FL=1